MATAVAFTGSVSEIGQTAGGGGAEDESFLLPWSTDWTALFMYFVCVSDEYIANSSRSTSTVLLRRCRSSKHIEVDVEEMYLPKRDANSRMMNWVLSAQGQTQYRDTT